MLGRGLETIWDAICDEAVAGNLKAQMEVVRMSDVPVASSKTDAERAEELSDADYEMLEALPPGVQDLCVRHRLSPSIIWGRHSRELPLSDDESLVAEALEEFDDEDDCYCMLYCLPDKDEGAYLGWWEMVPPPDYLAKEMVRQLRRKAGITASLSTGKVFYKKQDIVGEIECRSPSPQEIVLFLGERRPRLHNKKAGDRPGTPWRES